MKRNDARVTTLWVALAVVVVAALLHWNKPVAEPTTPSAPQGNPGALPHIGFGAQPESSKSAAHSPFAPTPQNAPAPFGPRPGRTALPFGATSRARLRAPKVVKPSIAPLRAQVGDTISVSLTQYCLRSLTRRDHATREGIVAADPRVFPLGREVDVFMDGQLLGRFLVDDTGLLIKGRILDIWVPECRAARRFGRQKGKAVLVAKD